MSVLRTPDERFENLAGFPFEPHYQETQEEDGETWASAVVGRISG